MEVVVMLCRRVFGQRLGFAGVAEQHFSQGAAAVGVGRGTTSTGVPFGRSVGRSRTTRPP
jgi:hypothetical protein